MDEGISESFIPQLEDFSLCPMGERAFLLRLTRAGYNFKAVSPALRRRFLQILRGLEARLSANSQDLELVVGYDSLLIAFEPEQIAAPTLAEWLQTELAAQVALWQQAGVSETKTGRLHRVGVFYGGEAGLDLERVAALNGISTHEVIARHTSTIYTVQIIGFAPGFAYLGDLPPGLDAPRLEHPRPKIPAGSVAIAAGMTAVYPFAMPGGWNILGYTPWPLFDTEHNPPVRFLPDDQVQFYPLSADFTLNDEAIWI